MTRLPHDRPVRRSRAGALSIRDVAAAAGVSHQTVSRVLNESPNVSADTRAIVLEVIGRLGYRPNRAAQALGLGRGNAVTVLTADTMLYGYASTLRGIEEAARLRGLSVGIRVIESDRPAHVHHAIEYVDDPSAGGVIVVAFDPAGAAVLRALPASVTAVAATEAGGLPEVTRTTVFLDEREAAAEATRHLLALGHRTVHHVAIPSESGTSARQAGWRAVLTAAAAAIPDVVAGGWDPESAYRAGRVLAADPGVTAILCGNDDTALGVRRALHEHGRDVPGEVSIVGFDDVPGAAYWTPALTTVRMDFVGLGRACLHALVAEQTGTGDGGFPLPAPQLILRESTAAPARR